MTSVILVDHPELALDSLIATRILFRGMAEGWFTGRKLGQYFNDTENDPINARQIINGNDKDNLIAGYHDLFAVALDAARIERCRCVNHNIWWALTPRVYRLLSQLTKRKSEMAVSITSAVRSADGTLTITGTEFTKTTTTVSVDGEPTPFEWVSGEEITVVDTEDDVAEVTVEKNGVTESADITDEDDEMKMTAAKLPRLPEPTRSRAKAPRRASTSQPRSSPEPAPAQPRPTGTNEGDPVDPTLFGGGAQHGIAGSGSDRSLHHACRRRSLQGVHPRRDGSRPAGHHPRHVAEPHRYLPRHRPCRGAYRAYPGGRREDAVSDRHSVGCWQEVLVAERLLQVRNPDLKEPEMALTPQPLFRAQDVGTSTVLGPVVPRNWRLKSNKIGSLTPANPAAAYPRYNSADYTGNAYGHDVNQAKSNVAVARQDGGAAETLGPMWRTQADKATALGTTLAVDVGRRAGGIEPHQPYPTKTDTPVVAPTLASLTPATAVAGAATPQFAIKLIGTGFTPWSRGLDGWRSGPHQHLHLHFADRDALPDEPCRFVCRYHHHQRCRSRRCLDNAAHLHMDMTHG